MRSPTTDEIMAACPETIQKKDIPTVNKGGRPRKGSPNAKRKWFSEEDRIRVATVYAATGSAVKTSEITGIKAGTIRQWRMQEWWPQVIERIQSETDDELDVEFTKVVKKSLSEINERIDNGDWFFDQKEGKLERVPIKGKDLGVLVSIAMEKRDLIRRKGKNAIEQASTRELLQGIATEVRKFTESKTHTIEGEIIDVGTGSTELQAHRGAEGNGAVDTAESLDSSGELPSGSDREGEEEHEQPISEVAKRGSPEA